MALVNGITPSKAGIAVAPYVVSKPTKKDTYYNSLSCSVTLEKSEPLLGNILFSGAATKKKGEKGCH